MAAEMVAAVAAMTTSVAATMSTTVRAGIECYERQCGNRCRDDGPDHGFLQAVLFAYNAFAT
jgi:hypothetical protein